MSQSKKIHRGPAYKVWREQVLREGNHRCCRCSATDNLTADHIKPSCTHPALRYRVRNGRVLCNSCRLRGMLDSLSRGLFRKGR